MFLWTWGSHNKLLLAIVGLLLLPVALAAFLLLNISHQEQYLMENQRIKLDQLVEELVNQVENRSGMLLSSTTLQKDKVNELNNMLHDFVKSNSHGFPELEVGFYSSNPSLKLVQGSGDYYLGRRFPTMQGDFLNDQEKTLMVGGQRSGTIIEIYKPLVVQGKVAGVIWGTENLNLTGIQAKMTATKHLAFGVMAISLILGLGGSFLLIEKFITGVKDIKTGLRVLEHDINYLLPPATGELGEIAAAVNHLSDQLVKAQSFNEISMASINDAIVVADTGEKIIIANRAALQILPLTEDYLGADLNEAFSLGSPFNDLMRDTIKEKKLLDKQRITWGYPGQRPNELLVSTTTLVDGRGNVIGAVLNCLDITENIRLQGQVHLQERLASLGKLVAGVAHEIRNPLASISGYIEYLQNIANPSPRSWSNINREINRLNLIVERLLYFAKPAEAKFVPGDINSLLGNALQFFLEANRDRVKVYNLQSKDLPSARLDPEQMEQALKNILFNAFQAMPGGGELYVRTGRKEDGRLLVEIRDTGPGINESDLPFLFDPFFTNRPGGTGLGLAIAHEIVTAHGGTIEVDSSPGQGATFQICLQPAGGE